MSMSVVPTLDQLDQATQEMVLDREVVDAMFHIVENEGQGHCMFYALSQIFTGKDGEAGQTQHLAIRKEVCAFYRTFHRERQYPDGSLEERIQLLLLSHEDDHGAAICRAGRTPEWGSLVDLYAVSLLRGVNILLFSLYRQSPHQYQMLPIRSPHGRGATTIYLRYNTLNEEEEHYEAMRPNWAWLYRSASPPPPSPPKSPPSPKPAKKRKQTQQSQKPQKTQKTQRTQEPQEVDPLVGQTVAKAFVNPDTGERDYYLGTVVAFQKPYYLVQYEDGDSEELTKRAVTNLILSGGGDQRRRAQRQRRTRKRTSCRSRRALRTRRRHGWST